MLGSNFFVQFLTENVKWRYLWSSLSVVFFFLVYLKALSGGPAGRMIMNVELKGM
jgi:hypothetical protein